VADNVRIKLIGIEQLTASLRSLPDKIRKRAVRGALRIAARVIRDDAKSRAPVLQQSIPQRTRGTVKRRISVRPSKFARQAGNEGVFIGVKPLRGKTDTRKFGKGSARNPNDPFYWRFLEFGTRKMGARPFLGPAARSKGEQAIARFLKEVVPQIQKLNRKGA
jgi:HK97 gp10 family phage protein